MQWRQLHGQEEADDEGFISEMSEQNLTLSKMEAYGNEIFFSKNS